MDERQNESGHLVSADRALKVYWSRDLRAPAHAVCIAGASPSLLYSHSVEFAPLPPARARVPQACPAAAIW